MRLVIKDLYPRGPWKARSWITDWPSQNHRCHDATMFFRLLFRILSGEPYRKATPTELRWYSGAFAFLPIWLVLFTRVGHSYLDRAGGFGIWLYMMGCIGVAALWLAVWTRFVPPVVSWTVAAMVWLVTLSLALTGRIF